MTATTLGGNAAPIREAVDAGLLAGALTLVWQHGEVLQVNEIGYRDIGARLPMLRDTVFRIASMTKPITVAAAMTLVDEGRLSLADPITHWLPEFAEPSVLFDPAGPLDKTSPAQRPITVDDLMTHRSGLAYGFTATGPIAREYRRLPFGQGADVWLAALAGLPLLHQPGERLVYSHAIDVLGVLLSRIEGKPLSRVLDERVLGPLGMTDTGFFVAPEARARTATMYRLSDGTLHDDVMGPVPIAPPTFPNAGGGLVSTADDYLAFARMLMGDGVLGRVRVLSTQSARAMRMDRLTADQRRQPFLGAPFWIGRGFGLNLSVVTDAAKSRPLFGPGGPGTFSWPGAYGTWWQADPSAGLILLYLVQNHPTLSMEAAAAVAGNTSQAALRAAQPKFVRRTYRALER
ncbi:MAG: serine hydrolase domain-containing protein [Mycobacterium sp.]